MQVGSWPWKVIRMMMMRPPPPCLILVILAAVTRLSGGVSWIDACSQASYCGAAPLEVDSYKEVQGMYLKTLAMVTRHGDRTPLGTRGDGAPTPCWSMLVDPDQCAFLPPDLRAAFSPTQPGMLTFEGRRQLVALGEALHFVYGPRLGLKRVRVESTGYPRTFLSARALLEGLVPDQLVNISIIEHATLPSSPPPPAPSPAPASKSVTGRSPAKGTGEGGEKSEGKRADSPMDEGTETILWTLTRSPPVAAGCPRLQEIQQRLQEQPSYQELRRKVNELMLDVSRDVSFGAVNDDLLCRACHKFTLPSSLRVDPSSDTSPSQLASSLCTLNQQVHAWWREASRKDAELVRLQVGYTLGRLFAFLAKGAGSIDGGHGRGDDWGLGGALIKHRGARKADDDDSNFYVLAAHDTTLTQLLIALGMDINEWPPYAAHLIIELWEPVASRPGGEGVQARVLYNGRVMSLPWCDGGKGRAYTCPWNRLIEHVSDILLYTEKDYQKACRQKDKPPAFL